MSSQSRPHADAQRADSRWLAVLLAPLFMYQADATIVNLATPTIRATLGASGAELELVVGGYLLASATLFITGARLGQARGYKPLFLTGLSLFGAASLACGLAPSAPALIAARVAQGAGGALLVPQILTGIQVTLEGERRTRALGLYGVALAAGAVVGQLLGGVVVSANLFGSHWRPVFLINVPISVAVLLAARRVLPAGAPVREGARLDLLGMVTLAAALFAIVLPLTVGRELGWPLWIWCVLGTSGPMLIGFVAVERRRGAASRSPLLNLELLRRPAVFWGLWPQAIAVSTYYALLFTLALYLQRGLGQSALLSGLTLVPWVAAFGLPGRLLARIPRRRRTMVAPVGCLILTAAYLAISMSVATGFDPVPLIMFLTVGGLGLGMNFSAILEHLVEAAGRDHAADISGVFTTSLQIAGAIGVAAFGTLYFALAPSSGPAHAGHAFAVTTAVFALTALIAAGAAYKAMQVRAPAAQLAAQS